MNGARELLSADVTLRDGANSSQPGPFVGREPVMRQLAQMRATSDADTLEPVSDFFYAADRVAVRFVWRGSGHWPQSEIEVTGVYTVREGRVVAIEHFLDHGEPLEAVGRRE